MIYRLFRLLMTLTQRSWFAMYLRDKARAVEIAQREAVWWVRNAKRD